MLTLAEARQRAIGFHATQVAGGPNELKVIDDLTISTDYGWVFFYNSARYLETGDVRFALARNGPLVVMKATGEVLPLDTARPVEHYLAELEKELGQI